MGTPRHVVVMGVAGTGKSVIGRAVAEHLRGVFIEGDEFHPQANIDKMASGTPLDDDDRRPWLEALAARIRELDDQGEVSITACSALRRRYRDWLREGHPELFFLHLHADYETLLDRMERREHFMPPSLLRSQFDTLEALDADEWGAVIDVRPGVEEVTEAAITAVTTAAHGAQRGQMR